MVSSEILLFDLEMVIYPCVFTESSFHVPLCPNFFFLYETSHIALGLTLKLPF